jgi:hypothetical protein
MASKRQSRISALIDIIEPTLFQPRGRHNAPDETDKLYRIPDHNRFDAWTLEKKQLLIDSIFRNYPIHGIIMTHHFQTNTAGEPTEFYNIEDGQCRLTALQGFYNNEFGIYLDSDQLTTFKELTERQRMTFCQYQVCIDTFKTPTPEEISDIFERLNNGTALTSGEKYYNRKDMQAVAYVFELIHSEKYANDCVTFMGKGLCQGKTRKSLDNLVGMVLAIGCDTIIHANAAYNMNCPYIHQFTQSNKELTDKFLEKYFEMLHTILDPLGGKIRPSYGKLSGILGLAIGSWIKYKDLKPFMYWYIEKKHSDPDYIPATFSDVKGGDLRNSQGSAIFVRVAAIELQYNLDTHVDTHTEL